ncbi:Cloroperoxidase [Mycena leptocephala]|nr:Cloroperoxidase [Mycena leptocephala]
MHTIHFTLTIVAIAASRTLAHAQDYFQGPWGEHRWVAPTVTDVRSPCPGLNTLANHGYLPRSGKNITIPMMLKGAGDGFNVKADALLVTIAKFGLLASNDPTTLNLDDLKLHNMIEHDASISRQDFALGDNLNFNETVFTTLANANQGVDYYNTTSAGQVMHARLADSLANNPNITNSPKSIGLRGVESALYLSVMGDPLTGIAPKKFVDIFFREERMPVAEGWKRPTTQLTIETLGRLQMIIIKASNDVPTQPCEPLVLGPAITL